MKRKNEMIKTKSPVQENEDYVFESFETEGHGCAYCNSGETEIVEHQREAGDIEPGHWFDILCRSCNRIDRPMVTESQLLAFLMVNG